MSDQDEPIASCRLMEVKKEVPAWLAHRNKVLANATPKKAAPSDESEIEEDEEVPIKGQEYDDDAARLFHNAGYSQETTSEILKDSRVSNRSNETSSEDSFSDDSGVLMSSTDSSGWSTPLEADMSESSVGGLDDIEEPPSEGDEQDMTEVTVEESYRPLEEPLNSQDNRSVGRQSLDYTEESYRTEDTFETVTDDGMEDLNLENPPENLPPQSDPYSSGNEKSTHSAASFWGNPVRFADPFREKDESNDNREPVGNKVKWAYGKPDSDDQEEDESPDPPAAMDGSIHRNENYVAAPKEKEPNQDNWMPPSSHQPEDMPASDQEQDDDGNEGILSAFTTTIAETMRKLTGGDVNPDTSNHSSRSARVDFAGHTISTAENIRKYYDKGRNSTANEDMRRLYMPTTVPEIANPNSEEEELFDWVPRKYTTAVPNGGANNEGIEAYYASAGEQYTSADDENYNSAFTSDDENYKSTDDRIYTTDEEDDIESNLSYEADGSDMDSVDSEHRTAKRSPSRTSETIDMTAMESPDASNQIMRKRFPCSFVHVCICLIVFLVPTIIFGIKYWPQFSSWVVNLF